MQFNFLVIFLHSSYYLTTEYKNFLQKTVEKAYKNYMGGVLLLLESQWFSLFLKPRASFFVKVNQKTNKKNKLKTDSSVFR